MAISITISSSDGDRVAQLDVEPHQTLTSVAARLQQEFGIPPGSQVLLLNGIALRHDSTFAAAGVQNDDLLVITVNNQTPSTRGGGASGPVVQMHARPGMRISDIPPNASAELLVDIIEKNPNLLSQINESNPKLGQALQTKSVSDVRMVLLEMYMAAASRNFQEQEEMRMLEQNPFDANAQAKIEERIRLSNVQQNMELAMEEMPEAFARVSMLYIPCEVDGVPVKAFVDSGAQSTIMSSNCAERCGIMRLVDKRFAGQAVGVGTAKIIGRVHMAPLKIGNVYYNCSFTILDQQSVDFLFGLDMLKRHQCCIDLQKNVLRLHDASGGHEVAFLPEHEIPASERADPGADAAAIPPTPPPGIPQAPTVASPTTAGESQADKVQRLVALGFDAQRATAALASTNGDVDLAAGLLFETMG